MKEITLICVQCSKTITIKGKDLDDLICNIDKSRWHDTTPAPYAYCPDCDKEMED